MCELLLLICLDLTCLTQKNICEVSRVRRGYTNDNTKPERDVFIKLETDGRRHHPACKDKIRKTNERQKKTHTNRISREENEEKKDF